MKDSATGTGGSACRGESLFFGLKKFESTSYWLGSLILALDVFLYLGFVTVALSPVSVGIKLVSALLAGFSIGLLFTIAHDACHQAWFASRFWNHVVGRLAFLPSFHSFSLWEEEHNWKHHSFTNIKELESAFVPKSVEEFEGLSRARRWIYRFFRTVPGLAFYYLFTVHLPRLIVPRRGLYRKFRKVFLLDVLLLNVFLPAQIYGLWNLAQALHANGLTSVDQAVNVAAFGLILPFLSWNFLVSFITYQQHTHPSIPWFTRAEKLDFVKTQLRISAGMQFPGLLARVFQDVENHSVHHVMMRIPLYRLRAAQKELVRLVGDGVTVIQWTPNEFLRTMRICKLYDFDNKKWVPYPASPPPKSQHIATPSPKC